MYAIVEVENTGTVDLYLKDAAFDLEDDSGTLMATYVNELAAGEQTSFGTDGLRLAGLDFNYSEIARYEVYASKTQLQF